MTVRRIFSFLISLFLTGVIALAQQAPPAPSAPFAPPAPGEPFGQAFSLFVDGGSFLGVYAEDINKENMGRYGLREARGAGITSVVKDSPAEKAGLRKDDVIVRFDNESVTSVRKLNRLVSEVAPDQTVKLAISRGGAEQEVAVTIGKRKDSSDAMQKLHGLSGKLEGLEGLMGPEGRTWKWEGPEGRGEGFVFAFGNNRRIGVSTTQLTKQLADYFGVTEGTGVLVTSVTDDGPAAKAGIKAGDVIVSLDGEKIADAGDLSRALNKKKEGDVILNIIRNKSQRTITVTPREFKSPFGRSGTGTQVGRRVIIPRIELPSIPEINIVVPRIDLPVIPEINVDIQRAPRSRLKVVPVAQPI
jgi:membrane-associated protease RseP (regulator of RpoE activity)